MKIHLVITSLVFVTVGAAVVLWAWLNPIYNAATGELLIRGDWRQSMGLLALAVGFIFGCVNTRRTSL